MRTKYLNVRQEVVEITEGELTEIRNMGIAYGMMIAFPCFFLIMLGVGILSALGVL